MGLVSAFVLTYFFAQPGLGNRAILNALYQREIQH
jgi:hypothetical protein